VDELDAILLKAWNRVGERVRRERTEALRRSQRRLKEVLRRPMREWCVVIRASDTRINDHAAVIEPAGADVAHEEHVVTMSGRLIRELTRPVMIPWPGVTYREAAALCGREHKTIKNWVKKGVFDVTRHPAFRFPESRGGGRPYLWTPSPIDPNNFDGRAPHRVWGTLWQSLWKRIPEQYELVVGRVPCFRPYRGELRFRGWSFVCPGRVDEDGEYVGCGRECRYLYAPQTVWTLAQATEGEVGFDLPPREESGLVGQWFPGLGDAIKATGPRSFACKECWGVRSACMANRNGWNDFITHVSGGLLFGRDVKRPESICPVERKKRPYSWKRSMGDARATAEEKRRTRAG
jgi:hypothetical protein